MSNLQNTGTDWSRFDESLMEAVNDAQVGFLFEEGGCWGMALALHQMLTEAGHHVVFAVQTEGFMHAWVVVDGKTHLDWQGQRISVPASFQVIDQEPRFREVAMTTGGCQVEDLLATEAQAADIVSRALRELSALA